MIIPPLPPTGREAEDATVLKPSIIAQRGGAAAVAASRRRGGLQSNGATTMRSRTTPSRYREPIYPMFLALAKQCTGVDDYWQSFFTSMANGRLPQGVTMQEESLVFKTRKKRSVFHLSEEARGNWELVADFFRNTCGRYSEQDWQNMKQDSVSANFFEEEDLSLGERNKRLKKRLANAIPEFAMILKKRHKLTTAEMSDVDAQLKYYSSNNLFRPGDIVYVEGSNTVIKEIKTLVFDPQTRRFKITDEAKGTRYSMKESYQDLISYLKGAPFTKPVERKTSFDDELIKKLKQIYLKPSTEPAAVTATKAKKKKSVKIVGVDTAEEQVPPVIAPVDDVLPLLEDDDDVDEI